MPKRIIDGDALWVSEKLTHVPERYRAEYAWLLPVANANGAFECSPMAIWRLCYSALRTDWQMSDVAAMLDAFETAKMLFRWTDKAGKTFGFFVGAQKSQRLPKPSDRIKYAEPWNRGMVPGRELAKFLRVSLKEVTTEYGDLLATNSRPGRDKVASNALTGNGGGASVGGGESDGSGAGASIAYGDGDGEQDGGGATNTATPHVATLSRNTSLPSTPNTNTTATLNTEEASVPDEDDFDELADDEEPCSFSCSDPYETVFSGITAKGFALYFRLVLRANPHAAEPPKGWKDEWEKDFKTLLQSVNRDELINILIISQIQKNSPYYVRPRKLIENLSLLREMVKERRKALPTLRADFKKLLKELEDMYGPV